jgi:hypothetical protein
MTGLIVGLSALVAAFLVISCSDDGVEPDANIISSGDTPVVPSSLKYNEVSFKEVHNSYQRHVPFETAMSWNKSQPWKFGCSCVEMDLRVDPAKLLAGEVDWSVGHAEFEPGDKHRFASYLGRLKAWSKANPSHRVITVQIDAKDQGIEPFFVANPGVYDQYVATLPGEFDAYIARYLGENLLFKPADIIKSHPDLVRGVMADGWPTLGELTGKFIIIFGKSYDDSRIYSDKKPKERLCFAMARMGDNDSFDTGSRIFFQWAIRTSANCDGAPWQERAMWIRAERSNFVMRGQNICQDADENGTPNCELHIRDKYEGEDMDGLELWGMASACGINMISSDLVDEEKWAMVGTMPYWPIAKRMWGPEDERLSDDNGAESSGGPGVANFQNKLYVVYNQANDLKYFTGDGSTWGTPRAVSAQGTGRPAVAAYGNDLWVASRNAAGNRVAVRSFNGSQWSTGLEIAGTSSDPGMAVYKDKLYVVYADQSNRVSYMSWNGVTWSKLVVAKGTAAGGPAVCVFEDKLCVFYRDANSDVYRTDFDGNNWSEPVNIEDINGAKTSGSIAAFVVGDEMDVIYPAADSDLIYTFTVLEGGHMSGQRILIEGSTSAGVGVARLGDEITLIYKDDGGGSLWAQTMIDGD